MKLCYVKVAALPVGSLYIVMPSLYDDISASVPQVSFLIRYSTASISFREASALLRQAK
jgi:hypothetical protein